MISNLLKAIASSETLDEALLEGKPVNYYRQYCKIVKGKPQANQPQDATMAPIDVEVCRLPLNNKTIQGLLDQKHGISKLKLSWVTNIESIVADLTQSLDQVNNYLTELHIEVGYPSPRSGYLSFDFALEIMRRCGNVTKLPSLEILKLEGFTMVGSDPSTMVNAMKPLRVLRGLSLRFNSDTSPQALCSILGGLTGPHSLQYLHLVTFIPYISSHKKQEDLFSAVQERYGPSAERSLVDAIRGFEESLEETSSLRAVTVSNGSGIGATYVPILSDRAVFCVKVNDLVASKNLLESPEDSNLWSTL